MKQVITIIMIGAAIWLGLRFSDYFQQRMRKADTDLNGPVRTAPGKLPGMSPDLEASLETAQKAGPAGLKSWLRQHRAEVEEPRLTDIDLDYVVLVGRSNPAEARRVLGAIKQRITPDSKAYKRFQQLDGVYR